MRTRAVTVATVAAVGLGRRRRARRRLPASAKSISTPNLKALTEQHQPGQEADLLGARTSSVSDGQTTTVTIAQSPPKSNFSDLERQRVINTGKTTYYCSPNSGSNSGNSGNTGSANSGNSGNSGSTTTTRPRRAGGSAVRHRERAPTRCSASRTSSARPSLLSVLTEAKVAAVARALGIKVSTSSATFAGQPSTCVTVTVQGPVGQVLRDQAGPPVVLGASSRSDYFKLTKYSSNPPASLFTLPGRRDHRRRCPGARSIPLERAGDRPLAGERRPTGRGLRPSLRGPGRHRHGHARRGGARRLLPPRRPCSMPAVAPAGSPSSSAGAATTSSASTSTRPCSRRPAPRRPTSTWVEGDLTDPTLDFGRTFDVVVMAGNVLIFVPAGTEGQVIANAARWLRPGGRLVTGYSLRPEGFGPVRPRRAGRRRGPRARGPLVHLGPAPLLARRPLRRLGAPAGGLRPSWPAHATEQQLWGAPGALNVQTNPASLGFWPWELRN